MAEQANTLTRTEILLESDMLGVLIGYYLYLFAILFVTFVNIFSIDKYELLCEKQTFFNFKRKLFFIINYSKDKKAVSKKTFILEMVSWSVVLISLGLLIVSLFFTVTQAFVMLTVSTIIVFTHGSIIAYLFRKAKKMYQSRPVRYDDD